jgi:hypothetical protein
MRSLQVVTFLSLSLTAGSFALAHHAVACDGEQCSKEEGAEKCTCKHGKGKKGQCPHCRHKGKKGAEPMENQGT